MPSYTITRGTNGLDFVHTKGGTIIGSITREPHGRTYTCTIEGKRTRGANGECRVGEHPAWLVKHARQAGLIGTRLAAPRKRKPSNKLRDQEQPNVLGYDLDRETLAPARRRIDTTTPGDYGCDPVGDGTFRMVPSGDIVDWDERCRRLDKKLRGLGAPRVTDADEVAWRQRFNADTPARELAAEMSRLREFEPRPMHKMFGTNGGTPEQRAAHAAKIRQWQRAMSYLRRLHKPALERDNAAFRAGNLGRCGRRRCRRR